MYRDSNDYDEIVKLVTEIYEDYDISTFPINAETIATKMGFQVIYYSELDMKSRIAAWKYTQFGTNGTNKKHDRKIYVNDKGNTKENQESTILHEIKHILFYENEEDEKNEDLADYFAKYMKCPIVYAIFKGYDNLADLKKDFALSEAMANNVLRNIENRKHKYGDSIFDEELRLLKQILKDKYNVDDLNIIKK